MVVSREERCPLNGHLGCLGLDGLQMRLREIIPLMNARGAHCRRPGCLNSLTAIFIRSDFMFETLQYLMMAQEDSLDVFQTFVKRSQGSTLEFPD